MSHSPTIELSPLAGEPSGPEPVSRRRRALWIAAMATLMIVVPVVIVVVLRDQGGRTAAPTPGSTSAAPFAPTVAPSGSPAPTPSTGQGAPGGTWRSLPKSGIARFESVGVWTGRELLIHSFLGDADALTSVDLAYDPAGNSWRQLPPSPQQAIRLEAGEQGVWTGTEMLLFGELNAAYNPTTNRWRSIPAGQAAASVLVWTGHQVLMWGGGCCASYLATGSSFDPATDSWRSLPAAPLAGRRTSGVWTGSEMIVVGGAGAGATTLADAAAYNPGTGSWRRLAPMPAGRAEATVSWTGTEVIVVGGYTATGSKTTISADALAYNPATDRWRQLAPMPLPRSRHLAVWTGQQLLVWGGQTGTRELPTVPPNGFSYDPSADRWSAMPASPLKGRIGAISAWTGTEMLVWGGDPVNSPWNGGFTDGAAYHP